MKTLKNILRIGALAGFMAFMSCTKDDLYETPHFKNVYEKQIAGNLERPSGLASNYGSKKSGTLKSTDYYLDKGIFIEGPIFYLDTFDDIYYGINTAKTINPKLSQLSGSLDNLTISSSQELNIKNFFDDFNPNKSSILSLPSDSLKPEFVKPWGLTLDNLILKDGSTLLSSNSADRLFEISSSGLETYLRDNRLERITDMIQGTNGKIYVVQAPLIKIKNNDTIIEIPKRVISIDNGNITKEFELPTNINTHFILFSSLPSWVNSVLKFNWWKNSPYYEKLKIIENSELGKQNFKAAEFYISDLLEDVIYKVDAQKNVSILAKGLKFPSSIAVDLEGNIFYTTSPMWVPGEKSIQYPTELRMLNPETGQSSSLIHKFNEKNTSEYVSTKSTIHIKYQGEEYVMPLGFNVTSILYESKDKMDFLFTNSHQGTLKWVSANKH